MSKYKKAYFGIITFCFFAFLLFNLALAVELPSINKAKIRMAILPGETKYGEIIVENTSSEPRAMRVYLSDWRYLPVADGTKEFMPANSTALSCAQWISFSPAEFTLAPFGRQQVNYAVKLPPEASAGHYAAMFFESVFGKLESQQQEFKAGMNIVVRIAALFYIEPEGTIKRAAQINNLRLQQEKAGSFKLNIDFKNIGNVDLTCGGTFAVMDELGMVYARGEFNDVYTFAGDSAKLSALCKDILPKGRYDLILTFNLGKALEEDNFGRGPVITKEIKIEIQDDGRVVALSALP